MKLFRKLLVDVQQLSNHFKWLSGILGCDWSITTFRGVLFPDNNPGTRSHLDR